MTVMTGHQPEIRFNKAGPYGIEGVSFEPLIINFHIDCVTAASENFDFLTLPSHAFIARAFARVDAALNATNAAVEIGLDGNIDALIDKSDFNSTVTDSWATNVGSTNCDNPNGLYLTASDILRVTVTGTNTTGEVSGFLEVYDLDAMAERGYHIDL